MMMGRSISSQQTRKRKNPIINLTAPRKLHNSPPYNIDKHAGSIKNIHLYLNFVFSDFKIA